MPQELREETPYGVEKIWSMPLNGVPPERQAVLPGLDCIHVVLPGLCTDEIAALLKKTDNLTRNTTQIVFIFSGLCDAAREADVGTLMAAHGWIIYHSGLLTLGRDGQPTWIVVAVRSGYNPIVHARQLSDAGRPDCAIAVLDAVPDDLACDAGLVAGLALERQRLYFHWQQLRKGKDPGHAFFSKARREFAQVTALKPLMSESYRLHANYWSSMGRGDMAARILRSIDFVQPEAANQKQLSAIEINACTARGFRSRETASVPRPRWWKPRILIITHDQPDYGMDSLYHGLRGLVGEGNVVEFPWKPTLHGQNEAEAANYPCFFRYPGKPKTVDQLVEELREGRFDFILYGDVVQMAYRDQVRRLFSAAPDVPVVLYDTWDDCYTPVKLLLNYTGRKRFDLIFKREMIHGAEYGPDTYPLPFAYPLDLAGRDTAGPKTASAFWAGKIEYGLRPLYIPALEKRLNRSLRERFDQQTYQARLRESLIGLSFFGCGFDTVRYWELPANQVMLMAEKPPICIPHDFVDGQTAVFFDDLPQMLEKLDYYLHHPDEAARIAKAGHAHFLRFHTTTARAAQLLDRVRETLRFPDNAEQSPAPSVPVDHGRASSLSAEKTAPAGNNTLLHLGLVRGEGYGWGVCSNYLIREVTRRRPVRVLQEEDGSAFDGALTGPLFQALTNVDLDPMFPRARGRRNIGYTFFENELTPHSVKNAERFDLVLGGSTWCRDRMMERGIRNCDILIQGIDPEIFHPVRPKIPDDRFVIFSGGKFELRKGQDLVLRAVKIMQDRYPDVWLVNCWFNLWPASTRLMSHSGYIRFRHAEGEAWLETMHRTYADNGLDASRIITHELVPQERQRELYARTDIGVFPNRCEGGTNLVLMEYMACAKPVIASNTSGHRDVLSSSNALLLNALSNLNVTDAGGKLIARWKDPSLEELVAQLDYAYHHRDALTPIGKTAGKDMKRFTWAHSAARLIEHVDGFA